MPDEPPSRAILDSLLATITPASHMQAAGARRRLAAAKPPGQPWSTLEETAVALAAARHAPRPRVSRKMVLVCAADHGIADPGIDLGDDAPTRASLAEIAAGRAAVCAAARSTEAAVVAVDAGLFGAPAPAGVVSARVRDGSADITAGPAMTAAEAAACVETGVALLLSLAEQGLDLLAVGQLGAGSQPASAAVIAAFTGARPDQLDPDDPEAVTAALAGRAPDPARPLDVLAKVGGTDIGVLAGAITGAAALCIPVVIDGAGTAAAALLATRLAPATAGYLFASNAGTSPAARAALRALALEPIFSLGVSHGEGTGAALALPFCDAAARLLQ